uniref:Capsid protein n=1 Tax=uncultured prokaryote TaxID=198431 RepID=A0A0H5Q723_9ZZZZ|nr:hypothetical protein [uncultured prokaryote]
MPYACISEVYDLNTEVGKGTVLKIHTPIGNNVKRHLFGHFLQYKKFRYLGADVQLVPASTLPADPLSLGYEAGEPTIDPRDMVNPILYKWYHGESMLTDHLTIFNPRPYTGVPEDAYEKLDQGYMGDSIDKQQYQNQFLSTELDHVYPMALMDPSFKKAGVQQGFRTICRPYVYEVVTNKQILPNQMFSVSSPNSEPVIESDNVYPQLFGKTNGVTGYADGFAVTSDGTGFTNKLTPLGWLDTVTNHWSFLDDNALNGIDPDFIPLSQPAEGNVNSKIAGTSGSFASQTYLPNIPMLYVLLPPAYKTMFYFRMIIKHRFAFKGFRSAVGVDSYGTFGWTGVPPVDAPATTASLAEMVKNLEGPADSVVVENGEIIPMADGVSG